jgi:hypothetical protein
MLQGSVELIGSGIEPLGGGRPHRRGDPVNAYAEDLEWDLSAYPLVE